MFWPSERREERDVTMGMTTTNESSNTHAHTAGSSAHPQRACCANCGDKNPPVRAPKIAWALIPLAWTLILGIGSVLAILVPLNLILIPCWFAVGSSLGALAREVLDPKCGGCGAPRGASYASWSANKSAADRRALADFARRAARPANEGAVEGGLV